MEIQKGDSKKRHKKVPHSSASYCSQLISKHGAREKNVLTIDPLIQDKS